MLSFFSQVSFSPFTLKRNKDRLYIQDTAAQRRCLPQDLQLFVFICCFKRPRHFWSDQLGVSLILSCLKLDFSTHVVLLQDIQNSSAAFVIMGKKNPLGLYWSYTWYYIQQSYSIQHKLELFVASLLFSNIMQLHTQYLKQSSAFISAPSRVTQYQQDFCFLLPASENDDI